MIAHLSGSFISLDEAEISDEDADGFVDVSGNPMMDTDGDGELVAGDEVLSFNVHRALVIIQRTK